MTKIVAVAGRKGGIGKTQVAIHLAAYLSGRGRTLLMDGDPNRNASEWRDVGEERVRAGEIREGLPFEVAGVARATRRVGEMDYVVMDTEAQPAYEDLADIAAGAHFMILPTQPHYGALKVLEKTVLDLHEMGRKDGYKVLLTVVPPRPSVEGDAARRRLEGHVPVFGAQIGRRAVVPRAEEEGVPVYAVRGNHMAKALAWREYKKVAEEVLRAL